MMEFRSRRPVLVCEQGCVASSQPLASQIGLDVLKAGGNAADAAVGVAAALAVTEPHSTGLGGDAFCLFYDVRSRQVRGLNGSGRCSQRAGVGVLGEEGWSEGARFPDRHGHSVTVPGAPAAWMDTLHHFGSGKVSAQQVLSPAIQLAETGFPVTFRTALHWKEAEALLVDRQNGQDMLLNGRAPRHGQVMTLPLMANVLKELANHGKEAFYQGRVARAISEAVQQHGGLLTSEDLANHSTTLDDPIFTDYRGCRVWQMPPNGQGMAVLIALNILEEFDLQGLAPNSSQYLHLLIEALRLSVTDNRAFTADPHHVTVPVHALVSKNYAATRRALLDPTRAMTTVDKGEPLTGSDTVYFCVTDQEGNACSFINSLFMDFGSGIVPKGCGFTLQNRGCHFSLEPSHPNVMEGGKRPFTTIIPSLVTSAQTGDLLSVFGVMGGFMQPQGQLQVLLNQVEFGMDPQRALDQPRVRVGDAVFGTGTSSVAVEEGIAAEVTQELRQLGHEVTEVVSGVERAKFGVGQVITRGAWWDRAGRGEGGGRVYWAGSDPRADGLAVGF
ncbi:glutathione hydrolase-like YwrD proenzyme [Babylonia areolata]|uniref:glutathione hydrolase-like YwrD proenzyme n=1 Tax=Babylonia areolata TaxID=304850 RepID=UPI003FD170D3